MRTHGDAPTLPRYGDSTGPVEPGADRPFPDCACPAPPLDVDAVRHATEAQLVTILDAAKAACLHRCPGWPERRREC